MDSVPSETDWHRIEALVNNIASRNYDALRKAGHTDLVSEDDIERILGEYPKKITALPEWYRQRVDIYPVKGDDNQLRIELPLWSNNEMTDLTIKLRLFLGHPNKIIISDIRVL
jgi:hypothetical protein